MKCLKCDGTGIHKHSGTVDIDTFSCMRCNGTGEVDFYTQVELTDQCTPEIIKKMVELAEGFKIVPDDYYGNIIILSDRRVLEQDLIKNEVVFPLLIHRAVEGWNKLNTSRDWMQCNQTYFVFYGGEPFFYMFADYQPTTLTQAECAMLDCLLEVLK